jgi:hypothetical protein
MNNKRREEKEITEDGTRRMEEFWSMLEHFWSALELKIEKIGCQA